MFSNPKLTFTHQPPLFPSLLCISHYLSLYSHLIFLPSLYSLWDFCLAVVSSWKARVLKKAEINQQWLFCERCVFVCFCWILVEGTPILSLLFLLFLVLPLSGFWVFPFSGLFPSFSVSLVLCSLSPYDFLRSNLERNSILIFLG